MWRHVGRMIARSPNTMLPACQGSTFSAAASAAPPRLPGSSFTCSFASQAARPATNIQEAAKDLDIPVYNIAGETVGQTTLPGDIFGVPVRRDILHRVVRWQLAKRQQGTHSSKTRAEVSGGGRKPRPQKGSGAARLGTIRAGQLRGGGAIHGPVVRSHEHSLNKKVRRLGLQCALAAKTREGRLRVFKDLLVPKAKTKALHHYLEDLLSEAPRRSVLMVDSDKLSTDGGADLRRAAANLPWVDVIPRQGLNVYSILQRDELFLTENALEDLIHHFATPIRR